MTNVAIRIPDATIPITNDDLRLLLDELHAINRPEASYDATTAIKELERTDVDQHDLPSTARWAVARALDHLRNAGNLTNRDGLQRIRDALVPNFMSRTYEIQIVDDWVENEGLFSYSGPYELGDRLVTRSGEWTVARIEPLGPDRARLWLKPFADD